MFDREATCSCVPPTAVVASNDIPDLRLPRSSSGSFPSLELMVIAGLLALILILLALIFSLVIRIQKLSRSVRHHQRAAAASSEDVGGDNNTSRGSLQPQHPPPQPHHSTSATIYSDLNCSTPSSGFYSELASGSENEMRPYRQQQPAAALDENYDRQRLRLQLQDTSCGGADSLYHSAESVRLNRIPRGGSEEAFYAGSFRIEDPAVSLQRSCRVPDHVLEATLGIGPATASRRVETSLSLSPSGRVETRLLDSSSGSGHNSRGGDRSLYETASHHIDEALRLLQESAEQL